MGTQTAISSLVSLLFSETLHFTKEEEELSYGSTMLTNALSCDASITVDDFLDEEGDIWLEDLAGESDEAARTPQQAVMSDLPVPPRRKLSLGPRESFGDFTGKITVNALRSRTRSPTTGKGKRDTAMMEMLSQSTGAINFGSTPLLQQPTCLTRARALSVGALDIASWKQADRRRMSKGKTLQGVSTSVRALPREAEIEDIEENKRHPHVPTCLKSRSRSPGTTRTARSTRERTMMERFSKSTGDISNFGRSSIVPQRTHFVRTRALSAGAGDSKSWKKTDRRRMPKGKLLQGISTSLRALPREAELQIEEDDAAERIVGKDDELDDKFQAIFDKIHEIDSRVQNMIETFSEESHLLQRPLDAVVETSMRSQRSEL